MPLVNAHTHLELGWAAHLYPAQPQPFVAWLRRGLRRQRLAQLDGHQQQREWQAIEAGIGALLAAGTTHVGEVTRTGASIAPLLASGLGGVVYIELLGLEEGIGEYLLARAQGWLAEYRRQEQNGLRLGLAVHGTYSTATPFLREVAQFCLAEDLPLCVHVGECAEEVELLVHGRGPLYDLPRQLGGQSYPPVPRQTPVRYLADLGVLEARPLLVHLTQISPDELPLLAQAGATVAHCPRANRQLQMGEMPLAAMLAQGIGVALGTESLAASPSLDVREEAGLLAPEVAEGLLGNTAVFTSPHTPS
jgi:aminodeoxyfutalosine deaminase